MSFSLSAIENEEEDDFGSLSSNSNLASIFNQETSSAQPIKKSLTYTAPKQPINTQPSQPVIAVAAVACYKLANEKYEPIHGKMGLALLAGNESETFRMVLYQNKRKPVATVKITSDFVFSSQPDNFCTFYDDCQRNWAVLFDSKQVAQKFIDEVDRMKIKSSISKKRIPPVPLKAEESSKTQLMSRIVKMGQPILPLTSALIAENSDSDQAVQSSTEPESEPPKSRKSRSRTNEHLPNSMMVPAQYHSPNTSEIPTGIPVNMIQYIPAFNPTGSSVHMDTLLSETRTQNSEIRMHLCRLSDKVDLSLQKSGKNDSQHEIYPSSILSSIQDLRADMMANFQALGEQSTIQMSKLANFQALQEQSTIQMSQLHNVLASIPQIDPANSANPILDCSSVPHTINLADDSAVVQQLKEENSRLLIEQETSSVDYERRIAELEQQLEMYRLKCTGSDDRLKQLEKDSLELKFKLSQSENEIVNERKNSLACLPVGEQVKGIMNKVYKASLKQFRPDETYSLRSIKTTLSLVIRDVTLAMLNEEAVETQQPVDETVDVENNKPLKTEENQEKEQDQEKKTEKDQDKEVNLTVEQIQPDIIMQEESRPAIKENSPDIKENPISYMESIQNSLAAAQSNIQVFYSFEFIVILQQ